MASFDDIFNPRGGGKSKFLKFTEDKETYLVQQSGEPIESPQKNEKGKLIYLVKLTTWPKYKPVAEGEFNENDENFENAFQPDPNYHFPVQIVGHKNAKGESLDDFDPAVEVNWDTSAGDTFNKLKDALMEAERGPEIGTLYAIKRIDSKKKPYTWSVKVIDQEG